MTTAKVIFISILIFIIFIIGISIFFNIKKNIELNKVKKLLEEKEKQEAENANHNSQVIEKAEKDKSEIRTGDHEHDIVSIADKLREYADKGKPG